MKVAAVEDTEAEDNTTRSTPPLAIAVAVASLLHHPSTTTMVHQTTMISYHKQMKKHKQW